MRICPEKPSKNTKNFSQNNKCPDRDANGEPLECMSRVLVIHQPARCNKILFLVVL